MTSSAATQSSADAPSGGGTSSSVSWKPPKVGASVCARATELHSSSSAADITDDVMAYRMAPVTSGTLHAPRS